jgi:hypothetical protein
MLHLSYRNAIMRAIRDKRKTRHDKRNEHRHRDEPTTRTNAIKNDDGSLKKRGVTNRTKRAVDALKKQQSKRAAKTKPATNAKTKRAAKTFTSVDLAREHNINPKTLRARIRRNIDKWEPLFKDNTRHVFADNATTRKRVEALLNA